MKSVIVQTHVTSQKTAILENEELVDLFIDDKKNKNMVSNIYRGIVRKVVTGIGACFIDIGTGKNAYLQINNNSKLKSGDELLVQVIKEEIGTKGAKISTEISLAGRYLVYIPDSKKIRISSKISDSGEVARLKNLVNELSLNEFEGIIRTEAKGCTLQDLENDYNLLINKYNDILREYKLGIGAKTIYQSESSAIKYINDNLNSKIDKIVVDNKEIFEKMRKKILSIDKNFINILVLEEIQDVFDVYKINSQIDKLFKRKTWLNSGGYLVIDKTEAMTVIDVNTGKFTKSSNIFETVLKTNIEAAKEIAKQLRLRDIGGIIIIDFIDMSSVEDKVKLMTYLKENLDRDKRKSEVLGMTKLGLVEVARRRVKSTFESYYLRNCFTCASENSIKSVEYIIDKIEEEVKKIKNHTIYRKVNIKLNRYTLDTIKDYYLNYIKSLKIKYDVDLELIVGEEIKYEGYSVLFNI